MSKQTKQQTIGVIIDVPTPGNFVLIAGYIEDQTEDFMNSIEEVEYDVNAQGSWDAFFVNNKYKSYKLKTQ